MSSRDSIYAFKGAAERYVALIDVAESAERLHLFLDLASALSGIYATALELPKSEPGSTDLVADGMGSEGRSESLKRMENLLGADDWYWTAVPFMKKDNPELVTGSLADDLTDVYLDLKSGLDQLGGGCA